MIVPKMKPGAKLQGLVAEDEAVSSLTHLSSGLLAFLRVHFGWRYCVSSTEVEWEVMGSAKRPSNVRFWRASPWVLHS